MAGNQRTRERKPPTKTKTKAKQARPAKATARPKPAGKARAKATATKPARTATKQAVAKPAKVPIAVVRKIADALAQELPANQVFGASVALHGVGDRAPAAAEAALGHTRKGSPLARAYLGALATGDPAAATTFVRHCATMELGRRALRGAFAAIAKLATDSVALEAAFQNFTRVIVDDPALLPIGIEAAHRRGDETSAAERTARLDRATRLAPLLVDLAGNGYARATKQLATLPAEDCWHVHARVLDQPRKFQEEQAIASVIAMADDPRVPDMAIASAVVEMHYHGEDELVEAWQARVADGDTTLTTRLLGMFEAVSLWASDDDHLEPYIKALHPAGGRGEVFAHVEHALASNNMVVRAAVLEHWLGEEQAFAKFDDGQADKLVRCAVAIAEAGEDEDAVREANRVLGWVSHAGARHALMDAVKHARSTHNDELRGELYGGLEHIEHPDVVRFLIERTFVERDEYAGLVDALAAKVDKTAPPFGGAVGVHRLVLDTFAARAGDPDAIHAAALYTDVVTHKKKSPRLLVELAHAIASWPPRSNDDSRRLRYVFEQATIAALSINDPDAARTFLARARALDVTPYSDYLVKGRDEKTPSPLAQHKPLVATLESGKLDREIAAARATADVARAAGKPIAADDARLGMLAGCTVSGRLLDDRERRVVWFWDEVHALHVYDGFSIAKPDFAAAPIAWDGAAKQLDGRDRIDDRVLQLAAKHPAAREVMRLGDRVVVREGHQPNMWNMLPLSGTVLVFASEGAASDAFARFAASPPAGLTNAPDLWYVDGVGAIRRKYYLSLGGGYNTDGEVNFAVLGKQIEGRADKLVPPLEPEHASHAAAVAAMQAWEGRLFAAGGHLTELGIDRDATRREDTLLAAFLDARYRTDSEGAAWHLRGLAEMMEAIAEANLASLVADIRVDLGPPASDADIAAYQALVPAPLPAPLVEVWREVGGGGFTSPHANVRLLSPREVVSDRDARRAKLRGWLTSHLKGRERDAMLALELDVIAERDGEPLIVYDIEQQRADIRCFCSTRSTWWEKSLGWEIATSITELLKRELEYRVGDVFRLKLGQRAGDAARRVRLVNRDKAWEAILDGPQLLTRTMAAKMPSFAVNAKGSRAPSVKTFASAEAAGKAFDTAIAAARKKGFR